jgi:hypothetical protein
MIAEDSLEFTVSCLTGYSHARPHYEDRTQYYILVLTLASPIHGAGIQQHNAISFLRTDSQRNISSFCVLYTCSDIFTPDRHLVNTSTGFILNWSVCQNYDRAGAKLVEIWSENYRMPNSRSIRNDFGRSRAFDKNWLRRFAWKLDRRRTVMQPIDLHWQPKISMLNPNIFSEATLFLGLAVDRTWGHNHNI